MRIISFLLILTLGSCITKTTSTNSLVGVYTLVSWEGLASDGSVVYPYGKRAIGQLIYDENGNMSMHLEAGEREMLGTDDYDSLDSAVVLSAYKTYFSYFGSYDVNSREGRIIHFIEGCKNPDWKGRSLVRRYEWKDDLLLIRSDSVIGMDHLLRWKKTAQFN